MVLLKEQYLSKAVTPEVVRGMEQICLSYFEKLDHAHEITKLINATLSGLLNLSSALPSTLGGLDSVMTALKSMYRENAVLLSSSMSDLYLVSNDLFNIIDEEATAMTMLEKLVESLDRNLRLRYNKDDEITKRYRIYDTPEYKSTLGRVLQLQNDFKRTTFKRVEVMNQIIGFLNNVIQLQREFVSSLKSVTSLTEYDLTKDKNLMAQLTAAYKSESSHFISALNELKSLHSSLFHLEEQIRKYEAQYRSRHNYDPIFIQMYNDIGNSSEGLYSMATKIERAIQSELKRLRSEVKSIEAREEQKKNKPKIEQAILVMQKHPNIVSLMNQKQTVEDVAAVQLESMADTVTELNDCMNRKGQELQYCVAHLKAAKDNDMNKMRQHIDHVRMLERSAEDRTKFADLLIMLHRQLQLAANDSMMREMSRQRLAYTTGIMKKIEVALNAQKEIGRLNQNLQSLAAVPLSVPIATKAKAAAAHSAALGQGMQLEIASALESAARQVVSNTPSASAIVATEKVQEALNKAVKHSFAHIADDAFAFKDMRDHGKSIEDIFPAVQRFENGDLKFVDGTGIPRSDAMGRLVSNAWAQPVQAGGGIMAGLLGNLSVRTNIFSNIEYMVDQINKQVDQEAVLMRTKLLVTARTPGERELVDVRVNITKELARSFALKQLMNMNIPGLEGVAGKDFKNLMEESFTREWTISETVDRYAVFIGNVDRFNGSYSKLLNVVGKVRRAIADSAKLEMGPISVWAKKLDDAMKALKSRFFVYKELCSAENVKLFKLFENSTLDKTIKEFDDAGKNITKRLDECEINLAASTLIITDTVYPLLVKLISETKKQEVEYLDKNVLSKRITPYFESIKSPLVARAKIIASQKLLRRQIAALLSIYQDLINTESELGAREIVSTNSEITTDNLNMAKTQLDDLESKLHPQNGKITAKIYQDVESIEAVNAQIDVLMRDFNNSENTEKGLNLLTLLKTRSQMLFILNQKIFQYQKLMTDYRIKSRELQKGSFMIMLRYLERVMPLQFARIESTYIALRLMNYIDQLINVSYNYLNTYVGRYPDLFTVKEIDELAKFRQAYENNVKPLLTNIVNTQTSYFENKINELDSVKGVTGGGKVQRDNLWKILYKLEIISVPESTIEYPNDNLSKNVMVALRYAGDLANENSDTIDEANKQLVAEYKQASDPTTGISAADYLKKNVLMESHGSSA